jgi:hypothetical protein
VVIVVDAGAVPGAVRLDDPEDCQRFEVRVVDRPDDLAAVLNSSGFGRLDDDAGHAWIYVEAVRSAAAGRVGPEWDGAFAAMLAYADSKGWLSAGGEEVRAHVEWSG